VFEPRRDLAAIKRRDGALTGSLGMLLHIERVIDRLGQPPCLIRSSKALPLLQDRTKKVICISFED
jgi:hypothetical protein